MPRWIQGTLTDSCLLKKSWKYLLALRQTYIRWNLYDCFNLLGRTIMSCNFSVPIATLYWLKYVCCGPVVRVHHCLLNGTNVPRAITYCHGWPNEHLISCRRLYIQLREYVIYMQSGTCWYQDTGLKQQCQNSALSSMLGWRSTQANKASSIRKNSDTERQI